MPDLVVSDDLTVFLQGKTVRLTPSQGFRLAERLIRRSTAEMVREEAQLPEQTAPRRAGSRKGRTDG